MNIIKKWIWRGTNVFLSHSSVQRKFTTIYRRNLFLGTESRSGEGSDLVQTKIIREELPKIVQALNVRVFIDAPCGDFFWMQAVNLGVEQYIGIDVVTELIEQNQQRYGNARRQFRCRDIIRDRLPSGDLVLCRDCLVHLNFEQAKNILLNIKRSGIKYLLATTFTNRDHNIDLTKNMFWRVLNLEQPPFSFPKPLLLINEGYVESNGEYADKSLGLWRLSDLALS